MGQCDIRVSLSAMEESSRSFAKCAQTLVEIANNLSILSASMAPAWEDPAQSKFDASFQNMVAEFDRIYECLNAMSMFAQGVADLYKATDQAVKSFL